MWCFGFMLYAWVHHEPQHKELYFRKSPFKVASCLRDNRCHQTYATYLGPTYLGPTYLGLGYLFLKQGLAVWVSDIVLQMAFLVQGNITADIGLDNYGAICMKDTHYTRNSNILLLFHFQT